MDFVSAYQDLTEVIQSATGMSRPMLHIHAGMAIYLLSQLVLGTRRGSILALTIVLEAAAFNEIMNRLHHGTWRWEDTSQDLLLTLFWPVGCVLVSKFRRWRWNRMQVRGSCRKRLVPAFASERSSSELPAEGKLAVPPR